MRTASKGQIKKIHVLLRQMGIVDFKETLVSHFSKGRAKSTKDLLVNEARDLIIALSLDESNDKMRKKIFALAYEVGIIWGETVEDKKMNAVILNKFILRKGTIKKQLNEMNAEELLKTVNQFENIAKHKNESKAAKLTTALLDELNIESSFKTRQSQLK